MKPLLQTVLLLAFVSGSLWSAPFDNRPLDRVLERFVNAQGQVDYAGLKANSQELDTYMAALARQSPDNAPELFPDRQHELAYWINAYNALVLKGVLKYYPIDSVRSARKAYGFFLRDRYTLGERRITLYTLENKVIRRRYEEPRVHFALNCASKGCPRLPPQAFSPERLEAELDATTREFIAHPEKVRVEGDRLKISPIFDWYKKDFLRYLKKTGGQKDSDLSDYIRRYAPASLVDQLKGKKVEFLDYDWGLNGQ